MEAPVNFSGKYFHVVPYGVNDDGVLDYDEILRDCKRMQTEDDHRRSQRLCKNH